MDFKICVIGCGSMSSHGHGPSYKRYAQNYDNTILAGCCDLDESRAAKYKADFGFSKYYMDMDLMLDTEKPDAVCVIVPEHLTARTSIKVLEKGYPLMMEKPPGLNSGETLEMIHMAERWNVPNQVAFNRRYMPLVGKLKEAIIKWRQSADIHHIRYDLYRVGRFDADFATTAIHGIDAARFIADSDYEQITFHYQPFSEYGPDVANFIMNCRFESGASAQLTFCPISGVIVERAVVNAYDNTWFMNLPIWNAADSPGRLTHYEKGSLKNDMTGDDLFREGDLYISNGFYNENVSFFEDIRAGRKPKGDLRSALQSVEIADCMRKREAGYKK